MSKRILRVNSLLKEVISQVIMREVRNPEVADLITVTNVDTSKDLRHAKVYISIIGSEEVREKTLEALKTAAGFIAVNAF